MSNKPLKIIKAINGPVQKFKGIPALKQSALAAQAHQKYQQEQQASQDKSSDAEQSRERQWWQSKYAIAGHIVLAYAAVQYYVYYLTTRSVPNSILSSTGGGGSTGAGSTQQKIEEKQQYNDNAQLWSQLASQYDQLIDGEELNMGLKLLRWWHISRFVGGDVLETACGTGRNLKYYGSQSVASGIFSANNKTVKSVTLLDNSSEMLRVAEEKLHALQQEQSKDHTQFETRFVQGSSTDMSEFSDDTFDTVVDTFGLCSVMPRCKSGVKDDFYQQDKSGALNNTENKQQTSDGKDAVDALNEMARVCKPDGRILLIQHGQATWQFLNGMLQKGHDKHFDKFGCHWSRDIDQLVAKSRLKVLWSQRWHFGSTYVIYAKPDKQQIV